MDLCRIAGKRLIHRVVSKPDLKLGIVTVRGQRGPACGANAGKGKYFFLVHRIYGEEKDITCKRCKELA